MFPSSLSQPCAAVPLYCMEGGKSIGNSKIANFFQPLRPRWRGSSWKWIPTQGGQKTRVMGLPGGQKSLISLSVSIQYRRVTDGQTRYGSKDCAMQSVARVKTLRALLEGIIHVFIILQAENRGKATAANCRTITTITTLTGFPCSRQLHALAVCSYKLQLVFTAMKIAHL